MYNTSASHSPHSGAGAVAPYKIETVILSEITSYEDMDSFLTFLSGTVSKLRTNYNSGEDGMSALSTQEFMNYSQLFKLLEVAQHLFE